MDEAVLAQPQEAQRPSEVRGGAGESISGESNSESNGIPMVKLRLHSRFVRGML